MAEVVRLDDVGVVDPGAEFRLAEESLDGHRVLRQAGAQDLQGRESAVGVFSLVHRRGAAFTDVLQEAVAGHGAAEETVFAHGMDQATSAREREQAAAAYAFSHRPLT
jgi:hypothetical protein